MKKSQWLFFIIIISLHACSDSNGWKQSQRDRLIQECKEKAISAMTTSGQTPDEATKTRLTTYCSCYQQNLEKQFPSAGNMTAANADDVAKAAQNCLELMVK